MYCVNDDVNCGVVVFRLVVHLLTVAVEMVERMTEAALNQLQDLLVLQMVKMYPCYDLINIMFQSS